MMGKKARRASDFKLYQLRIYSKYVALVLCTGFKSRLAALVLDVTLWFSISCQASDWSVTRSTDCRCTRTHHRHVQGQFTSNQIKFNLLSRNLPAGPDQCLRPIIEITHRS